MAPLATLTVKLEAQIAEFQSEFKQAAKSAEKFQDDFQATATKASAYGNLIARGIEIGVSAIKSLGEAALENASKIDDLSKKTGLSTDTIQEFQHVAGETGTTVDAFANAAFKLGTTLAGGGKSVEAGVKALGLSFDDLRSKSPDDQFRETIKALEDMDNKQEANRIGILLFGRTYRDMAVAVAEGYTALADGARKMSKEQIKRLADAEDAWKRFGRTAVIVSGEILAGSIDLADKLTDSWGAFFRFLAAGPAAGFVGVAPLSGEPLRQKVFEDTVAKNESAEEKRQALERIRLAGEIATSDEEGAKRSRKAIRSVRDEVETLIDVLNKTPSFDLGLTSLPGFQIEIDPPDLSVFRGGLQDEIELTKSNLPGIEIPITLPDDLPIPKQMSDRMKRLIEDFRNLGLDGAHTFAVGIAEGIRTGDWGAAGQAFENAMAQMMSDGMAAAVDFFVPGLGRALQPIFDAISKKITGAFDFNEGRDLVQDFAASFGGFDALHERLLEMGDAGEVLWKKLTQGVGRDNPEQAKAVIAEVTAALDAFGTEAERAATRMDGIGLAIDALNTKAQAFALPFQNLLSDEDAEDVKAKLAAMGQVGQAEFERIGTFAAAAFAGLVKETGNALSAIQQLGPTFQVLQDGVTKFGLTSTGTIDALIGMFSLVNDAVTGPILQAIQTTGQIFAGLQEGGIMTAELFQTIGTDIGASFRDLEAKGGDIARAMALSQPVLQRLWEGQQLYGDITDDTTQKILMQAAEQGLVGDHMKDVNQRILDVLILIGDVLGAKIPDALRGIPPVAAQTASEIERNFRDAGRTIQDEFNQAGKGIADQFEQNLSNIKVPKIIVDVEGRWDPSDFEGTFNGIPALASGGIVRRPTLALVGESGPEAVVPLSQLGSVGGGDSKITIELADSAGEVFASMAVPYLPGEARRYVGA
jgi:hypothetical protein